MGALLRTVTYGKGFEGVGVLLLVMTQTRGRGTLLLQDIPEQQVKCRGARLITGPDWRHLPGEASLGTAHVGWMQAAVEIK